MTTLIGRKQEQQKLHKLARITGTRSLLFIVGPSGIGKTTLTTSLTTHQDLTLAYIPFIEKPKNTQAAVQELLKSLGTPQPTRKLLHSIIIDLTKKTVGTETADQAKKLLETYNTGLKALAALLEKLAEKTSPDRPLVIALDEAQNLLAALDTSLWSFIKTLSTIQETHNTIRFIIVTSDYFFYEQIIQQAPSLDYIEAFYLGEMTREDAAKLYKTLTGQHPGNKIDMIGGKPAHIREIALYPEPEEKICSMTRRIYYAITTKLAGCEGELDDILALIAREPVPIARFWRFLTGTPRHCAEKIRWLVDADILQYGCKRYMGVYNWNKTSGGGLCGGLDSVGPSSRISYAAILAYLRDSGYEIVGQGDVKRILDARSVSVSQHALDLLGYCWGTV